MDSVLLAVVTSGLAMLASECGKGAASQAGKDLWARVSKLLGFGEADAKVTPRAIAQKLHSDPALLAQCESLLNELDLQSGSQVAGQLVREARAINMSVAQKVNTVNFNK